MLRWISTSSFCTLYMYTILGHQIANWQNSLIWYLNGLGRPPWGLESIGAKKRGYLGAVEGGKKAQSCRNSSIPLEKHLPSNRRQDAKWCKMFFLSFEQSLTPHSTWRVYGGVGVRVRYAYINSHLLIELNFVHYTCILYSLYLYS